MIQPPVPVICISSSEEEDEPEVVFIIEKEIRLCGEMERMRLQFPARAHASLSLLHQSYQDPDQERELWHYHRIAAAFRKYKEFANEKIEKTVNYINSLPSHYQMMLMDYKEHVSEIGKCVDVNHELFQLMILDTACMFQNQDQVYSQTTESEPPAEPTAFDHDQLQAVLTHIVRDWSVEGQKERETCYKPLIDEVETAYGKTKVNGYSDIRILVPGAGMGRLSHELVKKGYIVEGNEFSLFMIFAWNFILTKCPGKNMYKCHPWIHQNTSVLDHRDQTREVSFPDIDPCNLPPNANTRYSMTAGDFLEVYAAQDSAWDCIVTCFFIDCAKNIITYLERIFCCLKEGGLWINLGPLLYHYSDLPGVDSIEPPFDLLLGIIKKIGFKITKVNPSVPTMYTENEKSMLSYSYRSVFLVCRKPTKEEKQAN